MGRGQYSILPRGLYVLEFRTKALQLRVKLITTESQAKRKEDKIRMTRSHIYAVIVLCWSSSVLAATSPIKTKDICKATIAVAPPLVRDLKLSAALIALVKQEMIRRSTVACSIRNFSDQDKTDETFDRVGITPFFATDAKFLRAAQVEYLKSELNADYLIFIKPDPEGKTYAVQILKISEHFDVNTVISSFRIEQGQTYQLPRSKDWARLYTLLAPNTLTIGAVNTEVYFDSFRNEDTIEDTELRGYLPPIISSISLDKIEHFRNYSTFDYAASLFPSTFLFAIDQLTHYKEPSSPGKPGEEGTLHLAVHGACVNVMGQLSVHTPLGTTYIGLGLGPCLYRHYQDDKDVTFQATLATKIQMGQRAFFTEHWFVYLDSSGMNFHGEPLYRSEVARATNISRSSIGFGYYQPSAEKLFAKLLP